MAVLVIAAAGGGSPQVIPAGPLGTTGAKGDPGSPGEGYATRSAMAARAAPALLDDVYLTEAGREGKFVVDSASSWTAAIAADTAQGLFVVSTADATKVYRRVRNGGGDVKWFGSTGLGTADDSPASVAAIATLKSLAVNVSINGFYKGSPKLLYPSGHYFQGTTTLDLTHTLVIEGEGSGRFFGAATRLRWGAGTTGLRVQRFDTSGVSTVDASPFHFGGDGLTVSRMKLEGPFTATESEAHAVHGKGHTFLTDVWISNWEGDGFYGNAHLGSGGSDEGEISTSRLQLCRIDQVRRGVYLHGPDANVIDLDELDFTNCRQAGAWIDSGIGPVNLRGCHAATCGVGAGTVVPTQCSTAGNRYAARLGGTFSNAPSGTTADTADWYYIEAGGADAPNGIPAWSNLTTFRVGGAYIVANDTAVVTLAGCYAEDGQFSQFGGQTILLNCLISARYMRGGVVRHAVGGVDRTEGNMQIGGSLTAAGGNIQLIVGGIFLPSGYGYFINGLQVVGPRGAAVADATNATDVITQLNAALARLRAHGLIAP